MTPKEFAEKMRRRSAQVHAALRDALPKTAGAALREHYMRSFIIGGENGGAPWQTTKRQQGVGTYLMYGGDTGASNGMGRGAKASSGYYHTGPASMKYKPLNSSRSHLAKSISFAAGRYTVAIYTNVPYAKIHNEGGTTHPRVTYRMRAWAFRAFGHTKTTGPYRPGGEGLYKGIATTKKQTLDVRIPARPFLRPTRAAQAVFKKKVEEAILQALG